MFGLKSKKQIEEERQDQRELILLSGFTQEYVNDPFLHLMANLLNYTMKCDNETELNEACKLADRFYSLEPEQFIQGIYDLLPHNENGLMIKALLQRLIYDLMQRYSNRQE